MENGKNPINSGMMKCPKCNKLQEKSDECLYCGIIISKYMAYKAKKKRIEKQSIETKPIKTKPKYSFKSFQFRIFKNRIFWSFVTILLIIVSILVYRSPQNVYKSPQNVYKSPQNDVVLVNNLLDRIDNLKKQSKPFFTKEFQDLKSELRMAQETKKQDSESKRHIIDLEREIRSIPGRRNALNSGLVLVQNSLRNIRRNQMDGTYGFRARSGALERPTPIEELEDYVRSIERVLKRGFPSAGKMQKYGIFIGIDHFKDESISPLKGACNDAKALADTFRNFLNYSNIYLLTNASDNMPTKKNVLRTFKQVSKQVDENDRVIIFIATHSFIVENRKGAEIFFIMHDSKIVSKGNLKNLVSLNELFNSIDKIKSDYKILFLDTCRNNPFGDGRNFINPSFSHSINCKKNSFGIVSACSTYQTAREMIPSNSKSARGFRLHDNGDEGDEHMARGYFSYVLEKLIKEGSPHCYIPEVKISGWGKKFLCLFDKLGPHPGEDLRQGVRELSTLYRNSERMKDFSNDVSQEISSYPKSSQREVGLAAKKRMEGDMANQLLNLSKTKYQTPYFSGRFFDIFKDNPRDIPHSFENIHLPRADLRMKKYK